MPSTHTLIAVRCIGRTRRPAPASFVFSIGSSATTIGRKRTLDSVTASATSMSVAVFSVEIRITCAGAAHTSTVDSSIQFRLKPNS
jgi:hypothetical protein